VDSMALHRKQSDQDSAKLLALKKQGLVKRVQVEYYVEDKYYS
jgi:hypothetical protein